MAYTYYSFVNDTGYVINKEHANTSSVKTVPRLKSISNQRADPDVGVIK